MSKITDTFYAVLKPTRTRFGPVTNGVRPVESFSVEKIRRNKPPTAADEIAVRLEITLDSSIFDEVIPVVQIELGAKDVFVNAEVQVLPIEPEDDEE